MKILIHLTSITAIAALCVSCCSDRALPVLAPTEGENLATVRSTFGVPARQFSSASIDAQTYLHDSVALERFVSATRELPAVDVSIWERRCLGKTRERMVVLSNPTNGEVLAGETVYEQ